MTCSSKATWPWPSSLEVLFLVFAMSWRGWFLRSWEAEMDDKTNKGRTLWEMLLDRVHSSSNGNGAAITFANPLDVRVGSPFEIPFANGPDLAEYDFTVQEIREYVRRIGAQEFGFTDYGLGEFGRG